MLYIYMLYILYISPSTFKIYYVGLLYSLFNQTDSAVIWEQAYHVKI